MPEEALHPGGLAWRTERRSEDKFRHVLLLPEMRHKHPPEILPASPKKLDV